MLADRVAALRKTLLYTPRLVRNLTTGIRLQAIAPDGMRLAASFAVLQTLLNEPSSVFLCGRYYDRVVVDGGTLRFAERVCVTDATLVPTSLIFPL
jgi:3-phenylpropionate/cinnamic acid dioxygenase small subunit